MITPQNNILIADPSEPTAIALAATRDTLLDTDIYSRFLYSCENTFRRGAFYKNYKAYLMRLGLNRDQYMAGLNSDICSIELHHHYPQLRDAAILIIEHTLNAKGCVTTFEIVNALEDAHRNNELAVIFLSKTNHTAYHANPAEFISLKQCVGNPWAFIDKYMDGMTLDISFRMLLQLKQEEQYGESFSPNMVKLRDQILDWSNNTPKY